MLFLNIVSVQFNAVFPMLNKSCEACSIEIFVSTTIEISGHAAAPCHCFQI